MHQGKEFDISIHKHLILGDAFNLQTLLSMCKRTLLSQRYCEPLVFMLILENTLAINFCDSGTLFVTTRYANFVFIIWPTAKYNRIFGA